MVKKKMEHLERLAENVDGWNIFSRLAFRIANLVCMVSLFFYIFVLYLLPAFIFWGSSTVFN